MAGVERGGVEPQRQRDSAVGRTAYTRPAPTVNESTISKIKF